MRVAGGIIPFSHAGLGYARYADLAYFLQVFTGSPTPEPSSLIPRSRFMNDEAKTLTKRTATFVGGLAGADVLSDVYSSGFMGETYKQLTIKT